MSKNKQRVSDEIRGTLLYAIVNFVVGDPSFDKDDLLNIEKELREAVASERAEPTATEPDVPDKDRCGITRNGRRCRNWTINGTPYCSEHHNVCNFGPAPDVPYKHCSACGMRSHGTNAELRSQVEKLQKRLDMFDAVNKRQASHIDKLQGELTQAKRDTTGTHDQLSAVLDDNLRLRETLKKVNELAVFANNIVEKAGDA